MGLFFKTEVQGRPLWDCCPIAILSKQQNEVRKTAACIYEGKGGAFQGQGRGKCFMHLRSSWRRRVEARSWGCGSKGEADVKGPGSHFEWTLVHPECIWFWVC